MFDYDLFLIYEEISPRIHEFPMLPNCDIVMEKIDYRSMWIDFT